MHRGTPEKCGVIGYSIVYASLIVHRIVYVMQNQVNPRTITVVTRPVAMETPAHARTVCTRPFLLLKGLGTRLGSYHVPTSLCVVVALPATPIKYFSLYMNIERLDP